MWTDSVVSAGRAARSSVLGLRSPVVPTSNRPRWRNASAAFFQAFWLGVVWLSRELANRGGTARGRALHFGAQPGCVTRLTLDIAAFFLIDPSATGLEFKHYRHREAILAQHFQLVGEKNR